MGELEEKAQFAQLRTETMKQIVGSNMPAIAKDFHNFGEKTFVFVMLTFKFTIRSTAQSMLIMLLLFVFIRDSYKRSHSIVVSWVDQLSDCRFHCMVISC